MMRSCLVLLLSLGVVPAVADTVHSKRNIRVAQVITAEDVELLEPVVIGAAQGLAEVIGLEAKVMLYAGRPIRPDQVGPVTLVTRNQPVLLIYIGRGLRLEAEGRSLDRGSVGEEVRVLNLDSRRTVLGQVLPDGSIAVGGMRK